MSSKDNQEIVLSKDKLKSPEFINFSVSVLWNETMDHLVYIKDFKLFIHPILFWLDG